MVVKKGRKNIVQEKMINDEGSIGLVGTNLLANNNSISDQ